MAETAGPQIAPATKTSIEKVGGQELEQQITSGREMGLMAIGSHAPPNPRQVLHLQRLIGNRATISTLSAPRHRLQRDLDPHAVRLAIQYYSDHASEYPSFLIRRLQHALHVTPVTGRINEATVAAIARYQDQDRDAPLSPPTMLPTPLSGSGILTREEMVDMVAVGLEERSERTAYVAAAGELSERWASLSPDERLAEFSRLGNDRLTAINVPRIDFVSSDTLAPQTGAFTDPDTWQIQINEQILTSDVLPVDAVSTVYHEIRHAEQYFLAQRYEIQTHRIIEAINIPFNEWRAREFIRSDIAELARSSPLLVGEERQLARMMAHRFLDMPETDTSALMPLTQAFCAARDRHRADPSEENREAMDEARRAFDQGRRAYAEWWHEEDTGIIESLIAGEYIEANPDAPRTPAIDVCD